MAKLLGNEAQEAEYVTIDGQSEDITEISTDNEQRISEIMNEVNSDPNAQTVYAKVFKFVTGQRKPSFLFEINESEIRGLETRLSKIQRHGFGTYRVNIIKNGRLYKTEDLPIMGSEPEPSHAEVTKSDLQGAITAMAAAQRENFAQLREVLLTTTGRNAEPVNQVNQLRDTLAIIASMREAFAPPGNALSDTLSMLRAFKEIMPEGGGGGEKGTADIILKVLDNLGPMVPALAAKVMSPSLPGQRPPVASIADASASQGPQAGPSPQPGAQTINPSVMEQEQMSMKIKMFLSMLCMYAQKNSDPDLLAEMVLETVGDEQVIRNHLLAPDAIARAIALVPEVGLYEGWFKNLQVAVKDHLDNPEGTETPPVA